MTAYIPAILFLLQLADTRQREEIKYTQTQHNVRLWLFLKMIYYVDDFAETVKFYHSLLKENGRLMIVLEAGKFVIIELQTLPKLPQLF